MSDDEFPWERETPAPRPEEPDSFWSVAREFAHDLLIAPSAEELEEQRVKGEIPSPYPDAPRLASGSTDRIGQKYKYARRCLWMLLRAKDKESYDDASRDARRFLDSCLEDDSR